MRRLLFLAAVVGFVLWRGRQLNTYEREHGFGPYADVLPREAV